MDAATILNELRAKGHSFTSVGKVLGFTQAHVAFVARRRRSSHRVAAAIAAALDKPIHEVFPDIPEYHKPYTSQEARNRELALKLARQGLIQRRA